MNCVVESKANLKFNSERATHSCCRHEEEDLQKILGGGGQKGNCSALNISAEFIVGRTILQEQLSGVSEANRQLSPSHTIQYQC